MQEGSHSSTDVQQWETVIRVSGQAREVESWSVERECSGGLPEELDVTGSGITQATGSITFAGADVQDTMPNPFNSASGWVPEIDAPVEIEVREKGAGKFTRIFTGVISEVSGRAGGPVQAKIIDPLDTLDKPFKSPALCRMMPPESDSSFTDYIYMELTALTIIDRIARMAGFYATPPSEPGTVVNAPLMGSTYPSLGTLVSSRRATTSTAENYSKFPQITGAPWGFALSDFTAIYTFDAKPATSPIMLTLMATPQHTGTGRVTVNYTTGNISLNIVGSQVRAYVNNTIVATLARGAGEVFTFVLRDGVASIKSDADQTGVSASTVLAPSGTAARATVAADAAARLGGAIVTYPTSAAYDHVSSRRARTAFYDTSQSALMSFTDAMPSFDGSRTLLSVLKEIAAAKLSSVWFDELGRLQWANAPALEARRESREITTLDDIFDFGWKISNIQGASSVFVQGRSPNISVSRNHSRLLYQPTNAETVANGETVNIFAEPGTDESWLKPFISFSRVGNSSASFSVVNDSSRTVHGLYYARQNSSDEAPVYGDFVEVKLASLGYEKILISYTGKDIPAGYEGAVGVPEDNPNVARRHAGKALPRIVGGGRVLWGDVESEKTLDSSSQRTIFHDAGVWSGRADFETTTLDRMRDYLAEKASKPLPVVEDMPISPDPRLQLGDTVTISSETYLGVRLKALVLGISLSFDADAGLEMTIRVRVISVVATAMTYEQWQQLTASETMTYAQLNSLSPSPETYSAFNADPDS